MKKKLPLEDPNQPVNINTHPKHTPATPQPEKEKPKTWQVFVRKLGQPDPSVGEMKELEAGELSEEHNVELYNRLVAYYNYMPGVVQDKFVADLKLMDYADIEAAMEMHPDNQTKIILPN